MKAFVSGQEAPCLLYRTGAVTSNSYFIIFLWQSYQNNAHRNRCEEVQNNVLSWHSDPKQNKQVSDY